MSNDAVVNLIAQKFIQRRDVRAIQRGDLWMPDTVDRTRDGRRLPWDRAALSAHVQGERTYGHYLLDVENNCKLFAFDVDLMESGTWEDDNGATHVEPDLRGAWRNRSHPGRNYFKLQFREVAHHLARGIYEQLSIPVAVAYSGNKGIHVYGLTGTFPASDARDGAGIVLDSLGEFTAYRGINFFTHPRWTNLSIELFPKQGSLDGKDLGNLLRLPLGRNLKNPGDPTFFVDMTAPMGVLKPVDPEWALTTDNPWRRPGE